MKADLVRLGRWSWAEEEFARLEGTQWAPEEAGQAFLRLKGARDLNRRELALLREVVIWRDEVAREFDRSTFRVVSNEVLLEIARQAPATREALAAIKGMPRGMLESRGAEVLAGVRRGLAVPDAELPRFPKSARWERDPDFDDRVARLKAVRDAAAARLDVDPGVLCSRDRLELIARRKPASVEELAQMPELRRWQVAELGEAVVPALQDGSGNGRAVEPAGGSAAARAAAPPEPRAPAAAPAMGADDDSPYRPE